MYRTILVPIDGSQLAERALDTAAALACRMQSKVHLVHVHRERVADELAIYGLTGDAARATAEQYVLAAADRLRARVQPGQVSGILLDGSPAQAIVDRSTHVGADLIVMSSHGRTGASRFWLGSVADSVIRSASVPVLMIRNPGGEPASDHLFERVLVPLDGSAVAETALPHAIALAKLSEGHLHLLQVEERAEDLRTSVWGMAAHEPDDLPVRLERADCYLHTLVQRHELDWPPSTVSVESRGGHRIGETVAEVAIERGADLIALATHGRGGSRLLLGSVADKIVRGTSCSVLLVRGR